MTSTWLYRHPLLHGWWIAVAQNVAPRRFHARVQRVHDRDRRAMLESCDLPAFALTGAPGGFDPDNPEPQIAGGIGMVATTGRVGRRRSTTMVATSLSTTQQTAGGGRVRCTSHRGSSAGPEDPRQGHTVHNFLAGAGLADHPLVERREEALQPSRRYLLAIPDGAWQPVTLSVDDQPHEFRRATIDGHWLALGEVDGVSVAIEGDGVDVAFPLRLRKLDPPGA